MTKSRHPDTEPIPDTMENIARAIMQGPPKDEWRFEDELRAAKSGDQAGGEESGAASCAGHG